jgi:hypothetical protein
MPTPAPRQRPFELEAEKSEAFAPAREMVGIGLDSGEARDLAPRSRPAQAFAETDLVLRAGVTGRWEATQSKGRSGELETGLVRFSRRAEILSRRKDKYRAGPAR